MVVLLRECGLRYLDCAEDALEKSGWTRKALDVDLQAAEERVVNVSGEAEQFVEKQGEDRRVAITAAPEDADFRVSELFSCFCT